MRKSKIKKLLAVMTASMMLLGATVTSNAANTVKTADHVHAYSLTEPSCYNSYAIDPHRYVISTKTDGNGNVTTQYGSCDRVIYFYRAYWKCGCGAIEEGTTVYSQRIQHIHCGKGWE